MILIFFYIPLLLQTITVVTAADDSSQPSYPQEDIINLDCGSSGSNKDRVDRTWDGDSQSKFFISDQSRNRDTHACTAIQSLKRDDLIPYSTARLSSSEFTYSFPVTSGQKIIRLYFYPVSYDSNFDTAKALFSVKTGGFTLLSNFSAYLTGNSLELLEGFMKEFCLNVFGDKKNSTPMINITFTPNSDSFAFINGIEILSMPTNLYYSKDDETDANLIGEHISSYPIQNYSAMEMMYRINVGGNIIAPNDDTAGMYRTWDTEDYYLKIPGWSVIPDGGIGATINYTQKTPNYTAPDEVYLTARSLGNVNESLILSYNLTWDFLVDSKFYYLVRLHFCEIQLEINKTGDRIFIIYIADQIAEPRADVIRWSGGKFIPVYRDYVVPMFGRGGEKKLNLSIALRANQDASHYIDGILNGVEIFKLNDTIGNLAGTNPDPVAKTSTPTTPTAQHGTGKGKSNKTTVIGVVFGVVTGLGLLFVVGLLIFKRGRKVKNNESSEATALWRHVSLSTTNKSMKSQSSSLPSDLCRYFSLVEIKTATKNFDDLLIIGIGGFGNVYKGYIDGGTKPVAIKRLKPDSSQGVNEFKTEIEMLSQLRHLHLVSLIGYCNDHNEMILVYDYMSRGTLRDHLYNTQNPPLSWKQRLEICIEAARGLHYLHTGAKHMIIHRDIKTTNILLDEKWVAKVSDFGLSRIGPIGMSKAHVSTVVKGSFGYLDPEYYRRQQLTKKSDVYSFGVVLCEVLSSRPPIIRTMEKKQISLAEWARSCYRQNGTLDQIIDQNLRGKIAPECLKKFGEIVVNCMLDNGTKRPSMNDIVWALEFALEMQNSADERVHLTSGYIEMKFENEVPLMNAARDDNVMYTNSLEMTTTESKSSYFTQTSASGDTSNVFSEIHNPKGR